MFEYILHLWPESLTTRALLVGTAVGFVVYQMSKKRYRLPPGPPGWPILGNILDLQKGNFFKTTTKWSRKYGPIMTINLGVAKMVVLSKIDVVMEALVKRQADCAGRAHNYTGDYLSEGGKDIVAGDYGPTWKLHRKLVSKALRSYLVGDGLINKINMTLKLTTDLIKKETGPFDPYPYLSLCVFNILYGMTFNQHSPNADDENFQIIMGSIAVFFKEIGSGFLEDVFAPLRYFHTPRFRRVVRASKVYFGFIAQNVEEHQKTFVMGKVRDLTDAILTARKEAEEEDDPVLLSQITDKHVVYTIADVFFAGIDTTRNTLHWTLLALCLHPEVQKKLHEEVDSVIGSDLAVSMADREQLPYTEAVVCEAMRMRPVVPNGLPHMTLCDTNIGGYDIPKGTNILINHYALHFDPDQWEKPLEFRPERFLDASGKMAPKPESWLPFSAGRRVCLGETIAKPELHLLLAGIMRSISVSLAPGETHNFEPTPGVNDLPGPYKIVITPRC